MAIYLVVLSAVASLFPQGAPVEQYVARYGETGAQVLAAVGLDSYATSALFAGPVVLLEVSLLVCTIPRFAKRLRRPRTGADPPPRPRNASWYLAFAPDLIHFGLAVLVIGGALSFALREYDEGFAMVGETIGTESIDLRVESAEEIRSDRGDVVDWRVDLVAACAQTGTDGVESRALIVGANNPANVFGYRVHFRDYRDMPVLPVTGADGRTVDLGLGEGFFAGQFLFVFLEVDQESPLFYQVDAEQVAALEENNDGDGIRRLIGQAPIVRIEENTIVGGIAVGTVRLETRVAVSVTRDPGGLPVLVGFLILGLGMILFVLKKAVGRG